MNIPYEHDVSVDFHFAEIDKFPFPEEPCRKWILAIISKEKRNPGIINVVFCNDTYLLKINEEYLDHDTLTDIITFDYSDDFNSVSGDIFISIERIRDNCQDLRIAFLHELSRIIAHGVLHIIGYRDKQPDEKDVMTMKEDQYLSFADFL